MKKILLVNGPNLNMLGKREPEIYGGETLQDISKRIELYFQQARMDFIAFQSNHEGDLVDFLQTHSDASYILLNAGALSHTSIALYDALKGINVPFIELHISNVYAREPFRHHSYLSSLASGIIIGLGTKGYDLAATAVLERLSQKSL